MNNIKADIVILGGGIAGLWTLNYLNNLGLNAVLLENNKIGCGQTIKSQGIIHGGLKYALQGVLSKESQAISNMPTLWQQCLSGLGNIDLQTTQVLSSNQYLFSTNSLSSKITNFFASKLLSARIQSVKEADFFDIFGHDGFLGNVYKLDEVILNVKSLINNLYRNYENKIIKIDNSELNISKDDLGFIKHIDVSINKEKYKILASKFIFCAGENNKKLYKQSDKTDMQLRPLHMVYLVGKDLPKLYGHCVDGGMLPKATITTHFTNNGTPVWYIGGKPAEKGLDKDQETQIKDTVLELNNIFPWLNFDNLDSAGSFFINRAESKQKTGFKPENSTCFKEKNYIIAWPTKLALAPLLAESIFKLIDKKLIYKQSVIEDYSIYPKPAIANYPWD